MLSLVSSHALVTTHALVSPGSHYARPPRATLLRVPRVMLQQKYDPSAKQFDLLSLQSYRRETILQYGENFAFAVVSRRTMDAL